MADSLSIKVVIAGRTYPLTIKRSEEEQVRLSVAKINEGIKQLQENYNVRDKQDLLAMIALQLAIKEKAVPKNAVDDAAVFEALEGLEENLKSLLD
ncbi:MAG: cell division protein ZapA [Luteibaculaceae bacterium]